MTSQAESPTNITNQPFNRVAAISQYGTEDVIQVGTAPRPSCGPNEVLVRVRAASINPYDWHTVTGSPLIMRIGNGLFRPNTTTFGLDCAGEVVAIGEGVERFSIDDKVFGFGAGAFAEYVCADEQSLVVKPAEVSFEEAASAGIAAITALQGLVNHGQVKTGHRVLINGASGGVGTYAVQMAKHLGAKVTGVCSSRNMELIKSLGATNVVDYSTDDFTSCSEKYDVILDLVGNRKISHIKRCLAPAGVYVVASGPKRQIIGPIWYMLKSMLAFKFGSQRCVPFVAQQTLSDLQTIAELLAAGELRSVVESTYSLDDIGEAFRQIGTGHTRGKIVIRP